MSPLRIFYLLFALSGFAGLIYESLWSHYLKLILGHAAQAQTLVLVIFMGGMALGAWLVGWRARYWRHLLWLYAGVEILLGLAAFGFHPLFLGVLDSIPAHDLGKWSLAAVLILPQCVLLGATFPLLGNALLRRFPQQPGRMLALLYFSNSLGAALGVLAGGFLLLPRFGLPGTLVAAGLVNFLVAALVGWLERDGRLPPPRLAATPAMPGSPPRASHRLLFGFLLAAGVTGAASFMYEIGWIRMLSLVLGSSTHAFELMLSAFILGLALGGYWIRGRVDRLENLPATLGKIQVFMALFALASLPAYGWTFPAMSALLQHLPRNEFGYLLFNLASHGLAMAVMLPATFCAGMTLPLMTRYLLGHDMDERAVGGVYAANTLGSIVGVVMAGQWIMPWLGLKQVITLGAALDLGLGLVLLLYAWPRRRVLSAGLMAGGAYLLLFQVELDPLRMTSGVFRHGLLPGDVQRDILFHRDGRAASVAVIKDETMLSITTNGKPDASMGLAWPSQDEPTAVLSAALPWSMHPEAETIAVVGLGSGLTTASFLQIPTIRQVDTIEIEPVMVEGARYFGERVAGVFNDPRSRVVIEDAKTYFSRRGERYDLIVSEPSNPWISGVSGLFSREFYGLVAGYLRPGGLFVQWCQVYELDMPLLASVMRALSPVFEDYVIYTPIEGDLLIIARPHGQVPEPAARRLFELPGLGLELMRLGIRGERDLALRRLGSRRVLDPLFFSYAVPANSDYFPLLEHGASKALFMQSHARDLDSLRQQPIALVDMLENRPPPASPPDFGPNYHLGNAAEARRAMWIYRYLRWLAEGRPGEFKDGRHLDGETIALLRRLRSPHWQCQPGAVGPDWFQAEMEQGWFPALYRVTAALQPYLNTQEMEVLWHDLASSPCFEYFPTSIHAWLTLQQAVARRDAPAMARLALANLPEGPIPASEDTEYLLQMGLTALLSLDRREEAGDLWARYQAPPDPPLPLRLLAALTKKGEHGGQL